MTKFKEYRIDYLREHLKKKLSRFMDITMDITTDPLLIDKIINYPVQIRGSKRKIWTIDEIKEEEDITTPLYDLELSIVKTEDPFRFSESITEEINKIVDESNECKETILNQCVYPLIGDIQIGYKLYNQSNLVDKEIVHYYLPDFDVDSLQLALIGKINSEGLTSVSSLQRIVNKEWTLQFYIPN